MRSASKGIGSASWSCRFGRLVPESTRIHDIRGELVDGRVRVTGLATGRMGLLERFGIGTKGSGGPGTAQVHSVIPWSRVISVGSEVVVRDEVSD
jgi:hypothetical protein